MPTKIVMGFNEYRPDFRSLPHESTSEYLARGGRIEVIPYRFKELPSRRVFPTHHHTDGVWPDHDWRSGE
jgi:hypothetical protein